MSDYIPVEGHSSLVRDPESNAIINIDNYAYQQYLNIRDQKIKEREEIDQIKTDVNEIKDMMRLILEKL